MRCPYCHCEDTQVKDSRPMEEGSVIRRRRVCFSCTGRFTTLERVQLRELVVIKKSGHRVAFDRDKLTRSVQIALRKRDVNSEKLERIISDIIRRLETSVEAEVTTEEIGYLVMLTLKEIDDIAYIRFASVYRNFRNAHDFQDILLEISKISSLTSGNN